MRIESIVLAAIASAALFGCDSSDTSPTGTPSASSGSNLSKLASWAADSSLDLSFSADSDVVTSNFSWRSRWDSVVNLSKYKPAVQTDMQAIVADWKARDLSCRGWTVVSKETVESFGTLELVRFSVGGVEQGGIVWIPFASGSHQVVLFGHPDDQGMTGDYVGVLEELLGTSLATTVVVAPAYRGEIATLSGSDSVFADTVASDTSAQSPWDRDVDDELAMLQGALDHVSTADANDVVAVGYSRGAGVSLLAALRDARIKRVFEIAGPTDFLAPSIQKLAESISEGTSQDLPGFDYLSAKYVGPFLQGKISADSLRRVLLRRSAAHIAISGLLPTTVAVHGSADATVYPEQSAILAAASSKVNYHKISGMTHLGWLTNSTQFTEVQGLLTSFLGN
jgi:hypothetical protein